MTEFVYDTQLLIEGKSLSEDSIIEYITKEIEGDCLLVVGDDELIKIHFHTNTPWRLIEYATTLGEVFDVVIENMNRQERGLKG
jgi:dihydroxyacetone kinase-like predicted kinase